MEWKGNFKRLYYNLLHVYNKVSTFKVHDCISLPFTYIIVSDWTHEVKSAPTMQSWTRSIYRQRKARSKSRTSWKEFLIDKYKLKQCYRWHMWTFNRSYFRWSIIQNSYGVNGRWYQSQRFNFGSLLFTINIFCLGTIGLCIIRLVETHSVVIYMHTFYEQNINLSH